MVEHENVKDREHLANGEKTAHAGSHAGSPTRSESRRSATGTYITDGRPNGYTTLTPFIVVSDPAGAIAFYQTVFGAKAKNVTAFGDEGARVIVHADLDFGTGYLQLGAPTPEYNLVLPPGEGKACYSLGIYVPDVDRTLELALAHGATLREPATNFVSGDRYASIVDPYGIRWSIMTRVEDISEEESFRRVADSLFHEEGCMSMPPFTMWVRGKDNLARFFSLTRWHCQGSRFLPITVNGGYPSVAQYVPDSAPNVLVPWGIHVLEVKDHRILHVQNFIHRDLFARLGLPVQIPR